MAYIGKSIESGTFSVLDTSGNTYNGSNVTFSLGTQVGSPAQLLVSHDGVIQKPGTDYTLATGGTQITFTTAPASGASIFIVEISGAVGGPLDSDLNGTELILDADADTSITADTDDQIDFRAGGTDVMSMTATGLTINDGTTITTADNTDTLSLISTDADANAGPNLILYRNSGSPADDDLLGELTFRGRNDNSQDVDYFIIDSYIKDASDGTEDNVFSIKNMQAGTSRSYIKGSASELIINEDSVDLDFRVESNADTHAIYVNAGNDITSFYSDYGTNDPLSNSDDSYGLYVDNNGKTVINLNGDAMGVNRQNSDGTLINLFQEGNGEGSIAVSGSTVAYNTFCGTHWSRLADNSKPTILRGTIMESIATMMDWYNLDVKDESNNTIAKKSIKLPDGKNVGDSHTVTENGNDYTGIISKEDNEQLPMCKISNTADSKAVYGVFMAWDDQDNGLNGDVNDMYVAALGAFVVRIHKDQTVAIGDYLVSNGDGTAKKQADDILRSNTIAKVTSTTKTHTHGDGSYCVPCTLHCG
jgi:hypothetical protein